MIKYADRLEFTSPQGQYFNYCWWPYQPVAAVDTKFRPISLLLHSFGVAGISDRVFEVVRAIQHLIGLFRLRRQQAGMRYRVVLGRQRRSILIFPQGA